MSDKDFKSQEIKLKLGKGHTLWGGAKTEMKIVTHTDTGGEFLSVNVRGSHSDPAHFYLSVEDAIELSFKLFDLYEDRIKE